MAQFKQDAQGKLLRLSVSGGIDENFAPPAIDYAAFRELVIDWSGVDYINSLGIRAWISWNQLIPSSLRLIYERCPPLVVDQMAQIASLVPPSLAVRSMQLAYWCPSCKTDSLVVFGAEKSGLLGPGDAGRVPAEVPCSNCGKPAEAEDEASAVAVLQALQPLA
jgi:hypothetical protein